MPTKHKPSTFRRVLLWTFIVFVALSTAAAAASFHMVTNAVATINAISSDPWRDFEIVQATAEPVQTATTAAQATPTPAGNSVAAKIARNERIVILLAGYGGAGHEGAYLTDSIMLVELDTAFKRASMLSLPRDLWVSLPEGKYSGSYWSKINAAFSLGASRGDLDEGMRLLALTVTDVTGIAIDRTLSVDFRAFRAVVDALGGVEVDVERAFTSLYPAHDDVDVDSSWITVYFKAGLQRMDGETALRYSRARYSEDVEGSDFARAARQQKLMVAVKRRVFERRAVEDLLKLMGTLSGNVRTNLSLSDMQVLATHVALYNDTGTLRATLSPDNVLVSGQSSEGASILLGRNGDRELVRAYSRLQMRYPKALEETAQLRVRANRARSSDAQRAAALLRGLGFTVITDSTLDWEPQRTLVDSNVSKPQSVAFLSDYFAAFGVPGDLSETINITLGQDWKPVFSFIDIPEATSAPLEPSAQPTPRRSPPPTASATATAKPVPSASTAPAASASTSPTPVRTTAPAPSATPPAVPTISMPSSTPISTPRPVITAIPLPSASTAP